jgi:hypothetical protein
MNSGRASFWSSPWLFAAAAILLVLFLVAVLPGESARAARTTPEGASYDLSLFYTPAEAFEKAAAHSVEGRFAYIAARWSFDLAFPLVYGLFAFTGWTFALARLGSRAAELRGLAFVALLGPVLDFVENIAATVIMASVPARPPGWGIAASLATPLKWVFVVVGLGGAVALPVAAAIRALALRARSGG